MLSFLAIRILFFFFQRDTWKDGLGQEQINKCAIKIKFSLNEMVWNKLRLCWSTFNKDRLDVKHTQLSGERENAEAKKNNNDNSTLKNVYFSVHFMIHIMYN